MQQGSSQRAQNDNANVSDWVPIFTRVVRIAEHDPDAIAVRARDQSLSYGELVERVETLVGRLAPLLPRPEMLVAVCLERTVDLPAWLLAIFRLGAAYVPVDPTLPANRIAQVIDDAKPAFIVASRALAGSLPSTGLIIIDADDNGPFHTASSTAHVSTGPLDLAYVMYTSGSTGKPKGVEIMHGGIGTLLDGIARSPGLGRGETLLAPTRLSFDLSVIDIFLPLTNGARLVLLDLDDVADPRKLSQLIALHAPDLMQATPATWRALLEWGWTGCADMRLLCGGEAMTRDLADRLLPRCGELWNVYGPTEATVWSTAHRISSGKSAIAIGSPIDGTTVTIADDTLTQLPQGVIGEIVIGGPGVARGYRGAPALTAERFALSDDGTRLYRTGDLGRLGSDGLLYCLGRRDDQVKVRGFRIELGDIESALAAHPDVAWCAARVWPDITGENILVGYVVSRHGGAIRADDVKAFLSKTLPPYMIPGRIVPLVEMPMTPNGKVDRNALPNPLTRMRVSSTSVYGSDVERRLAGIWSELLGTANIGRSDDFFDLGGYSLITVRLLRRIEQDFDRTVEIVDLMRASTLSQMAALIVDERSIPAGPTMLLNSGGSRPPLYWLDAGPLMRGMARSVTQDQPIYALNLTMDDEAKLGSDVVDIASVAATLRRHLTKAQPFGPYYIGGWCRWGIVAQELACQLRDRGMDVALLVLLDAMVPIGNHPRELLRSGLAQVRQIFSRLPVSQATLSFSQRVQQASHRHVVRVFDGDTLLIRAANAPITPADDGGWREKVRGSLKVVRSEGNHETMARKPHAAQLAAYIETSLLLAQGARSNTNIAVTALLEGSR
jgi:amino acid adenylation domain-containing protein